MSALFLSLATDTAKRFLLIKLSYGKFNKKERKSNSVGWINTQKKDLRKTYSCAIFNNDTNEYMVSAKVSYLT